MNLDELRAVHSKEREKDSLQKLRPSFYQDVGTYIADLKSERADIAESASDPFSDPSISQLTDEIETAQDVVDAIYERRMGKLVKLASLVATGMSADRDGMTEEEAALFDDLVERIEDNRAAVFDSFDGPSETDRPSFDDEPETKPVDADGSDRPQAADIASNQHGDNEPEGEAKEPADSAESGEAESDSTEAPLERTTVRITRDIGPILGADNREYVLNSDDVVQLPAQNASPLLERDAAESIE